MSGRFLILALCVVGSWALSFNNQPIKVESVYQQWEDFKVQYNKEYTSVEEEKLRFNIFTESINRAAKKNADPRQKATFGITQFSDLTEFEFRDLYLQKHHPEPDFSDAEKVVYQPTAPLPSSFDWRSKGVVTPVKNQGQCGSCWAFSTVESIESQWILAGNSMQILSEQQIIDCDTVDQGCNGGNPPTAYQYVMQAGGLETEAQYPYTASDGQCSASGPYYGHISGYQWVVQQGNETQMAYALYNGGPLSICVDASTWQDYTGGVITSSCGDSLDHCVQATGFGVSSGTPFWWVRNSWGATWGQQGYLQVERGTRNVCGIASEVTLPSFTYVDNGSDKTWYGDTSTGSLLGKQKEYEGGNGHA